MSVEELIKELKTIVKVHPEAAKAEVWAEGHDATFHVYNIGYNKKRKPIRIVLES